MILAIKLKQVRVDELSTVEDINKVESALTAALLKYHRLGYTFSVPVKRYRANRNINNAR